MRRPVPQPLSEKERSLLETWGRGGSTPYRLVMRARIVLLAAQGCSNHEIARRLRTNPITVARWRSRFALLGVEGIRREAPRTGSPPPVPERLVRTILAKTLYERPRGRAHWSTRSLARATGVSHSTIRRIWKMHGIRPDRSRVARLAQDPRFRPKDVDLVGVYVNPPHRAAAFWFRNESKEVSKGPASHGGEAERLLPRSGRPWMSDLVTTLSLLDRREPPRTARRHMDQEFLAFLRAVQEGRMGKEKIVLLANESSPTLSPSLVQWLNRHPQVSTEVCAGTEEWKQRVVESIRENPQGRARQMPPAGVPGFVSAVHEWSREGENHPRPFAWTLDRPSDPRRAGPSRNSGVGYS